MIKYLSERFYFTVNLIYYGVHNSEIDSRIINARPDYVIGNPPHGLWGEVQGYDSPWLLQNVKSFQAAGIKVIGYLTAGYEGFKSGGGLSRQWYTLEMNRKLIKNMAEIDRLDGIFIDETSQYPGDASRKYLKELTEFVRGYGLITWGNTGENEFDDWYFKDGGFNFMQSTEHWRGGSLSRTQKEWGKRISVAGFKLAYTANDAVRLTLDAWRKGIRHCYITVDEYTSLAPWFEEYVSRLREKGRKIF